MGSTIYLNIGSNKGDRHENISRAVALLKECALFKGAEFIISSEYRSAPWGYESENYYINVGVGIVLPNKIECEEGVLHGVLDATQGVEKSIDASPHRNEDGSYRDRTIDIDIIEIDDMEFNSCRLVLPHPHSKSREFVVAAMRELGRWS